MPASSEDIPPLVITDGGIGGLLACWAEGVCVGPRPRSAGRGAVPAPVGFFAPLVPPTPGALAAAARQAELCHLSDMIVREAPAASQAPDPFAWTRLLLDAAAEASRRGITRIVWPIHAGGPGPDADLDAVAAACDRAMLVAHLAELDLPSAPRIDTPYADYTDRQMAEIALDMDAPLIAAWWCQERGDRPCGSCGACLRWSAAFDAARRGATPGKSGSTPDTVVTMEPRLRSHRDR